MKKTALCLAAQLAFAMSAAMPSLAQETGQETPAAEPDAPEIDWSRINIDALGLMQDRPQTGSVPRMPTPADAATWNRSENKNGSANVAQKQSWSNGISTNVGVNSVDGAGAQQGWPKPGAAQAPSSGTAWANAAVPGVGLVDQTTLDARVDPDGDQRKFGARFEKSIPLNPQFSVTLQNGYGLSQPLANQTIAGAPPPAHVFDSEQSAKLNVLNYGTSLFAGSKQSSTDERRLNSFGAEQNFLGGLSVSGSVNENTNGGHDRSLTARFRKSW
jgi:hypothetical protein